jgi:hypothetical protein
LQICLIEIISVGFFNFHQTKTSIGVYCRYDSPLTHIVVGKLSPNDYLDLHKVSS